MQNTIKALELIDDVVKKQTMHEQINFYLFCARRALRAKNVYLFDWFSNRYTKLVDDCCYNIAIIDKDCYRK
jgi:hypothetical protein